MKQKELYEADLTLLSRKANDARLLDKLQPSRNRDFRFDLGTMRELLEREVITHVPPFIILPY